MQNLRKLNYKLGTFTDCFKLKDRLKKLLKSLFTRMSFNFKVDQLNMHSSHYHDFPWPCTLDRKVYSEGEGAVG